MKVLIEGSTLFTQGYTGIPFYIQQLYKALNTTIDIKLAYNIRKIKHLKRLKVDFPYLWYLGNRTISFSYKPDISHSLHTPFLKIKNTKKIATIHDLAIHLPEFASNDFSTDYFREKRLSLLKDFSENADAIIAVSENTKQDFLKFFDYPEHQIHVIHLAPVFKPTITKNVSDNNILSKFNIHKKKFYLTVGGISYRKNSLNILKGFHLAKKHIDNKIVLTGKVSDTEKIKLNDYITKHNLHESVLSTGYISSDELHVLYENAKALLFPSFYEGFGIPIIEAMSYGIPVLTSKIGAAPEVAKSHAVLVDPYSKEDIAKGILEIDTLNTSFINNAKKYAETFTWEKVAKETVKVYESLLY